MHGQQNIKLTHYPGQNIEAGDQLRATSHIIAGTQRVGDWV